MSDIDLNEEILFLNHESCISLQIFKVHTHVLENSKVISYFNI